MMLTQPKPPALQAFNPDNIPDSLKANARWAPWKAVWSEKRQKYDKIPHLCLAPYYGISTAKPERWGTFEQALKAYAGRTDGASVAIARALSALLTSPQSKP